MASGGFGVPEEITLVGGGVGFFDGGSKQVYCIVERDGSIEISVEDMAERGVDVDAASRGADGVDLLVLVRHCGEHLFDSRGVAGDEVRVIGVIIDRVFASHCRRHLIVARCE